ncbi:MAG: hypothetical protein AAFR55_08625 [Pseudomonadota bacterium]
MPEQASAADGAIVSSDDAAVGSGAVIVNVVGPNAVAMPRGAATANVVGPNAVAMLRGAGTVNVVGPNAVVIPSGSGHLNAAAGQSADVTVSDAAMANVVVQNAAVRLNVGAARNGAETVVGTGARIAVAQDVASIVCRRSLFARARVVAHRGWPARSVGWSAKSAPRFVMAT